MTPELAVGIDNDSVGGSFTGDIVVSIDDLVEALIAVYLLKPGAGEAPSPPDGYVRRRFDAIREVLRFDVDPLTDPLQANKRFQRSTEIPDVIRMVDVALGAAKHEADPFSGFLGAPRVINKLYQRHGVNWPLADRVCGISGTAARLLVMITPGLACRSVPEAALDRYDLGPAPQSSEPR